MLAKYIFHNTRAIQCTKLEYHDSLMHATHSEKHLITPNHNTHGMHYIQVPSAIENLMSRIYYICDEHAAIAQVCFIGTAKAILVCVFSIPNSWARNQHLHQIAYTADMQHML